MKRPISILCMADLHCENGNMNAIDQLHKDYKEFVDQKVDNQRWNPDYIVVAGDVIDWTSQYNPDKYDYAKKSIDGLIEDFGIAPKHVIIVPGNHDNMISTDVKIKDLDQDRSIFEKFCNDEKFFLNFRLMFWLLNLIQQVTMDLILSRWEAVEKRVIEFISLLTS